MEMTKNQKVAAVSILIIIVVSFIFYFTKNSNENKNNGNPNDALSTTTSGVQVGTQGNGSYTIEQVPINEGKGVPQPIPDLNRPVTASNGASVSTEAIVRATEKILPLQSMLKGDPSNFNAWLDLGMYQKMAGDYQGTVISWQYAARLAPTSYIPLGNLGNLYAYFLKDNAKSEMYYKQAIAVDPKQAYLYIQLAEIYRDILNDISKAKVTIDSGLKAVPNDPNLLQEKASFM